MTHSGVCSVCRGVTHDGRLFHTINQYRQERSVKMRMRQMAACLSTCQRGPVYKACFPYICSKYNIPVVTLYENRNLMLQKFR